METKTNRFEILAEIARRILPLKDLDHLLGVIARSAVEILHVDRCLILWSNTDDSGWTLRYAYPAEEPGQEKQLISFSRSYVQQAVSERRTVCLRRTETPTSDPLTQSVVNLNLWTILCAPLILPRTHRIAGVIYVDSCTPERQFDEADIDLMETFASLTAISIENAFLYQQATFDGLTGVYARDFLLRRISEEFHRSYRTQRSLAVIICDLDNFKTINDRFGHLKGDQALKTFAQKLQKRVRDYDFVGRFGGDEFFLVMPGAGFYQAYRRCLELLVDLNRTFKTQFKGLTGVSIGGIAYPFTPVESVEELLKFADASLYRAKQMGKNRIYFHGQEEIERLYRKSRRGNVELPDLDMFMQVSPKISGLSFREHLWVQFAELTHTQKQFQEHLVRFEEKINELKKRLRQLNPSEYREIVNQTHRLHKAIIRGQKTLDSILTKLEAQRWDELKPFFQEPGTSDPNRR